MEEKKSSHWLDALSDGTAGLTTISSCLTVCDLRCDSYYKLIAAEVPLSLEPKPARLRVYKGNQVVNDQALPGFPSSVQSLYIDEIEPKMPIIAVSVGPSILFYRNMKPYFKYTMPSLMIEPLEEEIWKKLSVERQANYEKLINDLKSTMNISQMSTLSQKLISLCESEREDFIRENSEPKLERLSGIVCMTTIFKNIEEEKEPNCLIIATEASDIFIMDPQNFSILHEARVCSFKATPDLISASGSYQNDFKIIISSREGSICILRKGWLEGREIVKLEKPATSMSLLQIDQTIVVLSNSLMCYSKKGKMLWSLNMPEAVTCLTPVSLPHLGVSLVCIALANGLVQFYSHKKLVDEFQINGSVLAMYFGKLGLEEQVLVLVTRNGSLLIKILKRTADFSKPIETEDKHEEESTSLSIPKKSKIFLEQMERERENAAAIHNIFQSELWRMRLEAAKVTVDILRTGDSTFSGDLQTPLKLLAQVDGLGPDFLLTLTLENISATKIITNLAIILHANPNHYKIEKMYAELTPLVPGIPLVADFTVRIQLTSENTLPADMTLENSIVRVLIVKEKLAKPLIASTVVMPQPELQMLGTV
ncbi:hypothetical protein ACKWTF_011841 [Chironomus riparius]